MNRLAYSTTVIALRIGLASALSLLIGCAAVGPASISNGRMAYNEVLNYTEDQQLLNAIVRERYGQTFGMLSVSSVTANMKFRVSIDGEFRAWGTSETAAKVTPLSLGTAYEENPTISYAPIQGEAVLRRLVTPITIQEGFLLLSMARERQIVERFLFKRLNRLSAPLDGPRTPEAERAGFIARELREAGILRFGQVAGPDESRPQYMIIFEAYSDEYKPLIREYLGLLGVEEEVVDGRTITLPLRSSSTSDQNAVIDIETPSVLEWLRLAGIMIEVPEAHIAQGIVEPGGWSGREENRLMTIHTSKRRPGDAIVSIRFRDWWFFVDATDTRSKNSFALLKFLVRLRLNPEDTKQTVPVLTVPVG
jgi:hypothetical protein